MGTKMTKKIWEQKLQKYGNFCSQIIIIKRRKKSYVKVKERRNQI
jgi:hypothetical protein